MMMIWSMMTMIFSKNLPDTFTFFEPDNTPFQNITIDPLLDFPIEHTSEAFEENHVFNFPLFSFQHKVVEHIGTDPFTPENIVITIPAPVNGVQPESTITGFYGEDFFKGDPQNYKIIGLDNITTDYELYSEIPGVFPGGLVDQDPVRSGTPLDGEDITFKHITEFNHPTREVRVFTYKFREDTGDEFHYAHKVHIFPNYHLFWRAKLQRLVDIENAFFQTLVGDGSIEETKRAEVINTIINTS